MAETDKPCRMAASSGTEKSLFEDEALEAMWELSESGDVSLEKLISEVGSESGIMRMADDGLISISGDKAVFTETGKIRARDIVRRHRLAERLFTDVLDLSEYEEDACRFEHAISAEVEEAICTFLGHPPTCPHGKPIPRGNCCKLYAKKVRPLVQSLTDMEVGSSAKVMFMQTPAMDRLATMGLVPGAVVKLIQKRPSYVISVDETTLAIEEDIARGIYVKA